MNYQCAHCHKVFAENQAKCDNWLDDKRNMLCPYCEVALMPASRQSLPWQVRIKRINYRHFIWVAAFFLSLLLIDRQAGLPRMFPFVASFLALLGVIFYGWFSGAGPEPTKTVDIILEKADGDNVYEFQPREPKDNGGQGG